jgi:hypothetical protein
MIARLRLAADTLWELLQQGSWSRAGGAGKTVRSQAEPGNE